MMEARHDQQAELPGADERMRAVVAGVLRLVSDSGLVTVDTASCAFSAESTAEADAARMQMIGAALLSGEQEVVEAMEHGLFTQVRLETDAESDRPHLVLVPAIEDEEVNNEAEEPEPVVEDSLPPPAPVVEDEEEPDPESAPEDPLLVLDELPEPAVEELLEPPVEDDEPDIAALIEEEPVDIVDQDDDGAMPELKGTPMAPAPRFAIDKDVTDEMVTHYLTFGSDKEIPEQVKARIKSALHNLRRYAAYTSLSRDQQVILRGLANGEAPNTLWGGDDQVYQQAVEMLISVAMGQAPKPLAQPKPTPSERVVMPTPQAPAADTIREAAYGVDTRTTAAHAPRLGLTDEFIEQVRRQRAEDTRPKKVKVYTVKEVMDHNWAVRGLCATGEVNIDELNVDGAAQNDAAPKCNPCPVKTECMAHTLDTERASKRTITHVRAGLKSRDRKAIKKNAEGRAESWWQILGAKKAEYMTKEAQKAAQ